MDLEEIVLKHIKYYTRDNPIGRNQLVSYVNRYGYKASEREVRETIKQLRRQRYVICSLPGPAGGYYMARSREEYEEFKHVEFLAKIQDMSETLRAMDAGAKDMFGEGVQGFLFDYKT